MPWYFFAFSAPILYSFTSFIEKFLLDKKIKNPMTILFLTNLFWTLLGIVIWGLKGFPLLNLRETTVLLIAGIILVLYLIPYYKALKIDEVTRVVPLFQFSPVTVLILSYIFLKETLALKQIIGFIAVVFGGFLIARDSSQKGIFKMRKSFWFMLLSAFLYGLIGVLFRAIVKENDFWVILSYEYFGIGLGSIILLMINPNLLKEIRAESSGIKESVGFIVLSSFLSLVAQMSESFAYTLIAAPYVSLALGVQPLILFLEGIILSLFLPNFVKENMNKSVLINKTISILILLIGVYLMYF
jgi:drug/metabolite transporter (DMT)-like permease